jgi:predicted amidohydrolase
MRKQRAREAVITRARAETGLPLVYVNLVGGQDELVFDGGSFVMTPMPGADRAARAGLRGRRWSPVRFVRDARRRGGAAAGPMASPLLDEAQRLRALVLACATT